MPKLYLWFFVAVVLNGSYGFGSDELSCKERLQEMLLDPEKVSAEVIAEIDQTLVFESTIDTSFLTDAEFKVMLSWLDDSDPEIQISTLCMLKHFLSSLSRQKHYCLKIIAVVEPLIRGFSRIDNTAALASRLSRRVSDDAFPKGTELVLAFVTTLATELRKHPEVNVETVSFGSALLQGWRMQKKRTLPLIECTSRRVDVECVVLGSRIIPITLEVMAVVKSLLK